MAFIIELITGSNLIDIHKGLHKGNDMYNKYNIGSIYFPRMLFSSIKKLPVHNILCIRLVSRNYT